MVRNGVPFLLLVLLVRLVIPSRLGKMGVVEILLINTIGDLVSHVAFEEQHSLWRGVVSITLWTLFAGGGAYLARRAPWFRRFYYGTTHRVVTNGKAESNTLEELRITRDELEEALRKHGLRSVSQAATVTLETDGTMTIIEQDEVVQELRRISDTLTKLADRVSGSQGST